MADRTFEGRLSNVLRRTSALHPDDQAAAVIALLLDNGAVHGLTEGDTGRRLVSVVFSLPDHLIPPGEPACRFCNDTGTATSPVTGATGKCRHPSDIGDGTKEQGG